MNYEQIKNKKLNRLTLEFLQRPNTLLTQVFFPTEAKCGEVIEQTLKNYNEYHGLAIDPKSLFYWYPGLGSYIYKI